MCRQSNFINEYRVFPRACLGVLIWLLIDSYIWAKSIIPAEDVGMFTSAIISAVVLGIFAYMNTGKK